MSSIYLRCFISLFLLLLSLSLQAVPNLLSYQGYLTDPSGSPLNSTVNITFRLYDAKVVGSSQWTEMQSVEINQGLFQVVLGADNLNSLSEDLFDIPLWLGMAVEFDTEMSPRIALNSVGFALKAQDAETLSGSTAVELDQSLHIDDTSNPHSVTAEQLGAANSSELNNHISDTTNPHGVTDGQTGAAANLVNHTTNNSAHHSQTNSFNQLTDQASDAQIPASITRDTELAALQATVTILQATVNTLVQKLQYVTVFGNDMYITGANLNIHSGAGSTDAAVNGLGNLIVGYNDNDGGDHSGSHNLVIGDEHSYSSYGGFVTGYANTISGANSSVSGGDFNLASGMYASVSSGRNNEASGESSSVSGGNFNVASQIFSSVSGGNLNVASGGTSSVSGGIRNEASAGFSSVSGGVDNKATGFISSVGGGQNNEASGRNSSVSGGSDNKSNGWSTSIGGGRANIASGSYSMVVGGGYTGGASDGNEAYADYSVVVGGHNNVSGDGVSRTVGQSSSVLGGFDNDTTGFSSIVSGGKGNTSSGTYSSVGGGVFNLSSGENASVSGGQDNIASGFSASVSGGGDNTASGAYSSVSGGFKRESSNGHDWRAGTLFEDL